MIYHVFANRSNIGDWLSAKGIQKLLEPLSVTELLCDEPFLDQTFSVLDNAGPDDVILIGGGGLFMDYFAPFWERFEPISKRVPFYIWGVGCCDIKDEESLPPADLVQTIASRSSGCVVRDALSRNFLGNDNKARIVPCPSINFISTTSVGRGLLHVTNYTTVGAPAYDEMRRVGMEFAGRSDRKYDETNNLITQGRCGELDRQLARYKRADVVVSSALHGCVIAVAMGAKVLAVSGDRKIEGFMEQVGLGDWVIGNHELGELDQRLQAIDQQATVAHYVDDIRGANAEVARELKSRLASMQGRLGSSREPAQITLLEDTDH